MRRSGFGKRSAACVRTTDRPRHRSCSRLFSLPCGACGAEILRGSWGGFRSSTDMICNPCAPISSVERHRTRRRQRFSRGTGRDRACLATAANVGAGRAMADRAGTTQRGAVAVDPAPALPGKRVHRHNENRWWRTKRFVGHVWRFVVVNVVCRSRVARNVVCRSCSGICGRQGGLPVTCGRQHGLSVMFGGLWPSTRVAGHRWRTNRLVGHVLRPMAVKSRCEAGDAGAAAVLILAWSDAADRVAAAPGSAGVSPASTSSRASRVPARRRRSQEGASIAIMRTAGIRLR